MNKYFGLIKEAFFIGIILSIIGIIILFIFDKFFKNRNYYNMFFMFFICGIIFHFICEISGLNKWYCKNGIACNNSIDNITLKDYNPEIINPAYIRT
jgi:cell division protein FtsW (lipid II flippase)